MNRIKLNILANFGGQGWAALAQLAFVPLYLKFLGIEAYGLIGFYMMLQGILQILDVGLSMTINRELARYLTQPEKTGEPALEEARVALRVLRGLRGPLAGRDLRARARPPPRDLPVREGAG